MDGPRTTFRDSGKSCAGEHLSDSLSVTPTTWNLLCCWVTIMILPMMVWLGGSYGIKDVGNGDSENCKNSGRDIHQREWRRYLGKAEDGEVESTWKALR